MKNLIKPLFIPVFSLFIGTIGNSFFSTLLSLDLRELGFSNTAIGGIVSTYYAGMMIGSWLLEKKIHQVGFLKSYLILVLCNILFVALFPLSASLSYWYLIRFALGVILGGVFIIIESWILLLAPAEKKGEALALYMIGLYFGASLGQLLLKDFTRVFPVSILIPIFCCTIATIIILFASRQTIEKTDHPSTPLTTKQVLQKAPLGFFGNLLSGLTLSVFYGLVPVYGHVLGFGAEKIGLMMSLTIGGGFLGQWPIGKISDMISKDKMLLWNVIATCFICLPMLFGSQIPFELLCVSMLFFGMLIFTLYPLSINSLCEKLPQEQTLAAVTKGVIAYGIGCIIGPILASILMESSFKESLFVYFLINCALFLIRFYPALKTKAVDQQTPSQGL
jgi:MFS family permease